MEFDFEHEEIEIDLTELLELLLKKVWIIIGAAIVGMLLVWIYGKVIVTPIYVSTSSIVVINQNEEINSDGYYEQSTELTDDYVEVLTSRRVIEQVITNLGMSKTYEAMIGNISITIPEETRVIEITASDSNPVIAQKIAQQIQEVGSNAIEELLEVYSVRFLDEANLPTVSVGGTSKKMLILAFLGGACLVVGVIVVMFLLDGSIKKAEHVRRFLKCVVLGEVSAKKIDVEEYARLCTNVKASAEELHTVVVTSTTEKEGAKEISYELAAYFAESDKKVLYIDAGRRLEMETDKGENRKKSLVDKWHEGKALQEICEATDRKGLDIIKTEFSSKHSVCLDSKLFAEFLTVAKNNYDIVIIYASAVEKYIDAAVVAKQCDGTVVVVEAGKTHYKSVQKTLQQLAYMNATILGCVINKN